MSYKDKALQRETTRARVRRYRERKKALHKGVTINKEGVTQGDICPSFKSDLKAKLTNAGLKLDGNRISLASQSKSSLIKKDMNTRIPIYNPAVHRAGDRVLDPLTLREITIPEIDAEGNPITEY